jgi:hypothetical protein
MSLRERNRALVPEDLFGGQRLINVPRLRQFTPRTP